MSSKVTFQIVHGEGNIRFGPDGVDLSDFVMTSKGIDRPAERTFQSIYSWLLRGFRIDQEVYTMSVSVVVSRAIEGYFWELMPMDSTAAWRRYVEMAFERSWPLVIFVSVQEKDTNVSMQTEDVEGPSNAGDVVGPSMQNEENQPREEQAMGMADEGERVGIIVDEMEREDSDNEQAEDDASSDEEGDVMATDWANKDFSGLVISEGDHVPWEYKENEVIEGARYAHKDEMKEAVKHWAVSLQREFRVVKSTNYVYEVRCMKEDCPWRVHAYKGKWNDYWKVSIVTEHKCYLQGVEKYHRNITSAFVASEMYSSVVGNIGFEPKSIIRHIENKFKYTISYAKAWRAKQKIIEMRYGTFEASYDNLPRLLATIAQRNNNTYYDLHTFTSVEDRTKSVLQRAFFLLGACINAFVHCRPVLCIDGTFMTGKYRGQILTAIGCDGNNQVLPMAFVFVESENTESWYWFLERVHIAVVRMRPNVCLIHDRHAGMLRAIDYLQNGWDEKGLPAKWPDVRSRWCMRHMGANFYKQFKNKHLMDLFKRLCAQNQEKKFNELWDKLDELTTKQTDEQSRRPQVEGDEPPIPLGALHDDPPTMRRRSGSAIRNFSQWIENEPKEKWALLFDTDGSRYGIMTTNLAEVYNWVMRGVRVLPLVAIVEFILHGTQAYFRDRYKKIGPSMADNNIVFGNVVTKYMEDKIKKARRHRVVAQGTQVHRKEAIFHTWSEEIYGFGISGSYTTLSAQADLLHPDADDYSVRRSLEAYLLWLFGWVMFTSTHGHAVDFRLVHYARSIADAQPQDVPQWSWGSAVLAATYRALCEACTKTDAGAIIAGCPMLLQLWAAERFAIGRPVVDSAPYGVGRSAQWPEDGPTMGTYWCRHGRRYAHVQVRRGYPDFVFEFDRLQPSDVIWEPYTEEAVAARAPLGLSSLCTRDQAYWLTILPMVFDIFVEPHCPQRVMRQFELRQVFPGNVQPTVPPADHSLTRRGQLAGALWAPRVQQYVDDWVLATEEVINELFPHTEENYRDYLRWYLPRTRSRVTFTPDAPEPHVAAVTDAYPTHRDRDYFVAADAARDISADITAVQVRLNRGLHLTDVEQRATFDRMQEKMRAVMRVFSCRSAVDVVPPAGPVHPRPRAPTVGAGPRLSSSAPSFGAVRPTAPVSHGPRLHSSAFAGTTGASASSAGAFATSSGAFASSSSHGASIPHPHAGFAAGIFGTGASSSHAGRTGPTSQFYDDDLHGADHQDVLGSSQLGGAPEAHTQEQPEVTPVQAGRVGRAVPPDRLTYSQGHIRAQGRRDRVLFIHMVLEQLMLTTTHFRRFTVVPYPVARTVHNSTHEKRQLELSLSTFGAAC
uniref:Transposon protein, putative, Mutator sub-class n=1 Tax=Oryza sativa subsp. japonica TaxID=39947 RepID=Q2R061_ORYSJ|nr:transposon protein, putative, Mutator sub-class [Oryza sativa Japonica Group]